MLMNRNNICRITHETVSQFRDVNQSVFLDSYIHKTTKVGDIRHCFRHTYATLQLAAGTDLYTISKMLTHSTVATTQVYADVVNDLKRKASEQITLK